MAQLDFSYAGRGPTTIDDAGARARRLRRWALRALGLLSVLLALGGSWDVKWHYVVGRDTFWIPPHDLLYASVALIGLLSAGVVLYETLRLRGQGRALPGSLRLLGFQGPAGFFISGFGVVMMLLAGPFDNLWHQLYGVDVTIWSPPHMLGVAGGATIAAGGLVASLGAWRDQPGREQSLMLLFFCMTLVNSACFALLPAIKLSFWPHTPSVGVDPLAPSLLLYPVFASLTLAAPFVLAARLSPWRWLAPAVVLGLFAGLTLLELIGARLGFELFVPWDDQVMIRQPERVESVFWDLVWLQILPVAALSMALALLSRRATTGGWRAGALAGGLFGALLMAESTLLFQARNPEDQLAPALLLGGLTLCLAGGALAGALASASSESGERRSSRRAQAQQN